MLLGTLPTHELLTQNNLREFRPIVHAIRTGNLGLMEDALSRYEFFFVRTGIYLLVEKLKLIVIRQLFKKVKQMAGSHQLQLQLFLDALHFAGMTDCDMEELECIMAGLISNDLIRGYISDQYKKVVFSRKEPFPKVSSCKLLR